MHLPPPRTPQRLPFSQYLISRMRRESVGGCLWKQNSVDDKKVLPSLVATAKKKWGRVRGREANGASKLKFMIESERVLEVLFIFAILKLTWLFVRTYLSPLTPIVLWEKVCVCVCLCECGCADEWVFPEWEWKRDRRCFMPGKRERLWEKGWSACVPVYVRVCQHERCVNFFLVRRQPCHDVEAENVVGQGRERES